MSFNRTDALNQLLDIGLEKGTLTAGEASDILHPLSLTDHELRLVMEFLDAANIEITGDLKPLFTQKEIPLKPKGSEFYDKETIYVLKELESVKILSLEEIEAIFSKKFLEIETEDVEKVLKSNLGVVVAHAEEYAHEDIPFAKLVKVGCEALFDALASFNLERGDFFSHISHFIRRALASEVYFSCTIYNKITMMNLTRYLFWFNHLSSQWGRCPTSEDMNSRVSLMPYSSKPVVSLAKRYLPSRLLPEDCDSTV